ncbi:MAG: acyl-coenzyme A synthetase/AMP-(fatty) acid ligase [Paracoccaceae bacterium]|jgi:acyl-coenzyme A synthetase/AMP-(fatty) acid ligase
MAPRDIPTAPNESRYRSVASMLREHAEIRGDKPFIVSIDEPGNEDGEENARSITFGQLWRLSNRLARFLAEKGIGAGGRIAVLTDNRLEMPTLYYAIQRYGAAFCTINVEVNASHVCEMLDRITPDLVLWHEDLDASGYGEADARWIRFGACAPSGNPGGGAAADGGLFEALNGYSDADDAPEAPHGPDDLCVLSFTSGTSAAPKGVLHRFGNYYWIADQTIDMWKLTDADRMLEFRSLSWASSHMLCLNPALRVGATILLAARFSRSRFFDWLRDQAPSMVIGVPTVINMLLEHDPTPADIAATQALRFMSSSTAPLMVDQHRRFEDTYGIELVQLYGMSEGGIVASNHVGMRRIGSVGPPGLYQNLKIIAPDGIGMPEGDRGEIGVGEIEIGGAQPAGGYLLADGTVEPIGRLKTGDLGYLDADGFLIITGRAKDVIIRGGVNIAPLEIDNALAAHADIREAATIGVPHHLYGEQPVSFVTLRPGTVIDEAAIRTHCADRLSDFKTPARVIFLEDIPKNNRGKIDRAALEALWRANYAD